jgi:hypothetical protein
MTNDQKIYAIAIACGALALIVYVALIVVPAWCAYSRIWQRFAAVFLTLYVLAGFVILGAAGGAAVIWFWDRIGT